MTCRSWSRTGAIPAIGYMILAIAALAITMFIIYGYLWPSATSIVGSAKFLVEDVHLGQNSFTVTIKNLGQVKITHIWVWINTYKLIDRGLGVPPGGEVTCTIINGVYKECCGSGNSGSTGLNNVPDVQPGQSYRITVVVEFANGERKSWTTSIVASVS